MKTYYIYILASRKHGTLYIGITSDILRRIAEHNSKNMSGFTQKYNVCKLVHIEEYDDVGQAIWREKSLKRWKRDWKIRLIEESNPDWIDLYDGLYLSF